ncbi:MAG: hypothetical protein JNK27_01640 [Chitinophagaceae bacterium]|nr:hypothetical protein [Chitinophagaceae bacterium]
MLFFNINFIPASVRITEVYVINEDTKQGLMGEIRNCSSFYTIPADRSGRKDIARNVRGEELKARVSKAGEGKRV